MWRKQWPPWRCGRGGFNTFRMASIVVSGKKLKYINKNVAARWDRRDVPGFIDAWTASIENSTEKLIIVTEDGLTLALDDRDVVVQWKDIVRYRPNGRIGFETGESFSISLFHPDHTESLTRLIEERSPASSRRHSLEASPGMQPMSDSDRILTGCTLLLSAGTHGDTAAHAPTGVGCVFAVREAAVEAWTYRSSEGHAAISIERASIIDVDISGGELVKSGGGIIGGGFGLEGAAIGMAAAGLLNALTTRTNQQPVQLVITTTTGLIVLSTQQLGALELRGILAPLFCDVIANRGRLARTQGRVGSSP
jgi:hypothetical protein